MPECVPWFRSSLMSTSTRHQFGKLFLCDSDLPVKRNSCTCQQRAKKIALVTFDIGEITSGLERTASFTGDDKRQVLPGMVVSVFQAGSPHHDAIVEQCAAALLQAGHLLHHVGKLSNVESVDLGDLVEHHFIVVMVCLGVMLVAEAKLRV